MQPFITDLARALILVLPCHGVFLSLFFLIHSERVPGPNLIMGLLLLVFSSVSFFQFSYPQVANISLIYPGYSFDLLVSPFLFLYTSVLIHPRQKSNAFIRLFFIAVVMVMLMFFYRGNQLIRTIMVALITVTNGLYMLASFYLLVFLFQTDVADGRRLLNSEYSSILILNTLVLLTLLICIIIHVIFPSRAVYLVQLPKGIVIYYVYYKILVNVDITN
jgi:hypothetical protein